MKLALIGYGKMGHEIERIALQRGHEIVCIIDLDNVQDFESEAFRNADVAIEFTSPLSAYQNCIRAFNANVKVVSGSTGWIDEHGDDIRQRCTEEHKTLFWSSNFSLGVAIFSALNKYLAQIMNQYDNYVPSLTETHHIHKLDAPSGTAITLAEELVKNVNRISNWVKGEATSACELGVKSVREGEVPGIHTISYESDADRIIITHDAKNRRGFALGAVLAAEFTVQHEGFLSMNDLFNFSQS